MQSNVLEQRSAALPANLAVERAIRHVRSRQQRIQDARDDFTAYKRYVWRRYKHAAHLEMIDQKVAQVIKYVESGGAEGIGRLMICVPPRHGKSVTVARLLPPWFMGRNPDMRVIQASYGASLSEKHSRFVRDLMKSGPHLDIFPGVSPSRDSGARDAWDLRPPHEGGMDAVGKGGAITGKGANLIIADDLVKSRSEAESLTVRNNDWEWWKDDLLTRLEPGGGIILINTRWHEDDVAGRILLNEAGLWTVLILPALALEDDAMGRLEGEPLWPERFSRSALERQRRTMGEYSFEALYQQNPRPRDGGLFRRSAVSEHILNDPPSDIVRRVRYWDLAMSDKKTADWTCGVLLGYTTNGNIIVLDVARAQVDWSVVPSFISEVMLKDGPAVPQGIEGAFYQSQMTATLLRMPALMRHSIRAFPVETDKWQRALPWSARWGAGQVYLLRRTWTAAYIDEHCSFPQGTHDDQVDASSGALNALAGAMRPVTVKKVKVMA